MAVDGGGGAASESASPARALRPSDLAQPCRTTSYSLSHFGRLIYAVTLGKRKWETAYVETECRQLNRRFRMSKRLIIIYFGAGMPILKYTALVSV